MSNPRHPSKSAIQVSCLISKWDDNGANGLHGYKTVKMNKELIRKWTTV